jgi:hypothetical protein
MLPTTMMVLLLYFAHAHGSDGWESSSNPESSRNSHVTGNDATDLQLHTLSEEWMNLFANKLWSPGHFLKYLGNRCAFNDEKCRQFRARDLLDNSPPPSYDTEYRQFPTFDGEKTTPVYGQNMLPQERVTRSLMEVIRDNRPRDIAAGQHVSIHGAVDSIADILRNINQRKQANRLNFIRQRLTEIGK